MNQTSNYQLNQWDSDDRILRTDFNSDNAKIDAALAEKGNCRIFSGSYVGNGNSGLYNPCSFTFPSRPLIGFIVDPVDAYLLFFSYGMEESLCFCTASYEYNLTWSEDENGCTMEWSISSMYAKPQTQANVNGRTYHIYALLAAEV